MLTESGFFKEDAQRVSRSSVPPDLAPGRRIAGGKYELLRKIGTGAMGEVWAAKHVSLDEEVAIRLVLRGVEHDDGSTADGRFLVEARVARMLSRKTRHIVSVTDHGDDGDIAYLVMELLNGEPLDTRLARSGPLPLEKVVPVITQVARALAVAHAEGIVHRDLKPGNVFLTLDEEGKPLIKILDFGIAKLTSDPEASSPRESLRPPVGVSAHEAKQKTLRGFLLGTPAYMSPEQARGKSIDHRADVWALAVITYHLLTTQFPFDGKDAEELFKRLVRVQAYPITDHRQDLPPAVSELFAKAFAKKIEDRFASAEDFASALHAAAGHRAPAKISIAPPAPPPVTGGAAKKDESSIIAAGVPRNDRRGPIVAAVVALALAAMIAIGYGRFGHSSPAAGLAAGAVSTMETGATTLTRSDEIIPPPEPVPPPPVETAPLPVGALPAAPPPATAPAPEPEPSAVAIPIPPPPVPPPPAKKPVDKSEVF
jgi:serine/threonine-protein kinase